MPICVVHRLYEFSYNILTNGLLIDDKEAGRPRLKWEIALSSKPTKAVKYNGSKYLELLGERFRRITINNDAKR